MDRQVLHVKITYLHKSLPKIPTLGGPKRKLKKFGLTLSNCVEIIYCSCNLYIVLMTILFNDVTVC